MSPQAYDLGCKDSSAAGREERAFPPHFGAGKRHHPCDRHCDEHFSMFSHFGSDDPVIFPNIF